jgi:hypothetical protein
MMRKNSITLIAFILLTFVSISPLRANASFILLDKSNAESLYSSLSAEYSRDRLTLVLLNPNDCGYCINALHSLSKDQGASKVIVLLQSRLNDAQIEALKVNYHLDSSVHVISDMQLNDRLYSLSGLENIAESRALLLNGNVLSYKLLKEYRANYGVQSKISISNPVQVDQSEYFFSFLGGVAEMGEEGYLALAYPKADIIHIDRQGKVISKLVLDDEILKVVFNENLKELPAEYVDSNSFASSKETYTKVMIPMGFSTCQAELVRVHEGKVWAVVNGKFPMQDSPDNMTFMFQKLLLQLSVSENEIKIDKSFILPKIKSKPKGWFLYPPNYFTFTSKDKFVIGYGGGRKGTMASGSDLLLEEFALVDSKVVHLGTQKLCPIDSYIQSSNDTLANLAYITSKVNNGVAFDTYFRHIPGFVNHADHTVKYLKLDISQTPRSYKNIYSIEDSDNQKIKSLISYRGVLYSCVFNTVNLEIASFTPIKFTDSLALQSIVSGEETKTGYYITSDNGSVIARFEIASVR